MKRDQVLRFPHKFMQEPSFGRMQTKASFAAYPAIVMFVPAANP